MFSKLRRYLKIARADEIARRYLVMNGFDGALVVLGVIVGTYALGSFDPRLVVSAGLGASLAMGVSGAWGALMAERAERAKGIKELEQALFTRLGGSMIDRASKVAIFWVAFINALSPVIAALITLTPILLSIYGVIPIGVAFFASVATNMALLFILGLFLGRVSKSNMLLQGALMVFAGVATSLLILILGLAPL